jgi:hypothetical protein
MQSYPASSQGWIMLPVLSHNDSTSLLIFLFYHSL